jgi:hypothetical protein
MKKIILIKFLLFASISLSGQTFMTSFKHSFKGLNIESSGVTHIKDIACPQIQLSQLDGSGKIDSNYLNVAEELFRIFQFSKTKGKAEISQWDTLMKLRNEYLSKKVIPLMLFDFNIHEFSDSFWNGQGYSILSDSQYLIKSGPWKKTDFQNTNIFYFIPLVSAFDLEYQFVILDERFVISNRPNDTSVRYGIDINGHYCQLMYNHFSQIIGLKPGLNDCRLSLEASANSDRFLLSSKYYTMPSARRTFVSWIQFNNSISVPNWKSILSNCDLETIQVKTIGKSIDGLNITLGANMTVHYGKDEKTHRAHSCLKNPIVFIEGIDFGYRNNPTGCRDGKCGNMGYLDLLKGQQWNVELKKWESWKSIENAPKIVNEYRDSGFDIIYIDFWDGAELIENNALVVYQCLKNISNRLCGNEIHVVGVSMGGLIGKRALTMLENDTQTYCVKSFTAFDSPLLGANIALSLQATASYYSDLFGISRDMKERMLNRPASKQMLLMHFEQTDGPHLLRNKFMSDQSMQDFPIIPWNWGIVNGSNQGMPQQKIDGTYLAPGEMLLHVNAFEELKSKLTKIGLITGKMGIYLAGKLLPSTDAKLFAYQAPLKGSPTGKGVVAVFESNIAKDKTWFVDAKKQGLDQQCGSRNNSILTFANISKGTLGTIKTTLITENTCFIPIWSAIGNYSGSQNWTSPLSFEVGETPLLLRNTPFQDYYAQSENQDHAFFDSSRNGNAFWLLRKIIASNNLISLTIDSHYFIGNIGDRFIGNVDIKKGGILQINNWKKGFNPTNSALDSLVITRQSNRVFYLGDCKEKIIHAQSGSTINLGSGLSNYQSTILHVKNQSTIIIDSGSIIHLTGKRSKLIIHKNAVLTLRDHSELIIDDGCELIIEEGGKMIVGKKVNFYLNGINAQLQLGGAIQLESNADIVIKAQPEFSTGLIKLTNVGGGFGKCSFYGQGNSKFQFLGNDKNASTVLQIEGIVNTDGVFDTINISRSNVSFGNQSQFICSGILHISDSKFSPASWAKSKSSSLTLKTGKITMERSLFERMNVGLNLLEGTKNCFVSRTNFTGCVTGIQSSGSHLFVSHCTFKSNDVGAEIHSSLSTDSFDNCYFFSHVNMGIYAETIDTSTIPLTINSCGFYKNPIAAQSNNRSLAFSCDILGYNTTGIVLNNAKLICGIGSGEKINGDTVSAGFNTFAFQEDASIKANNSSLYLNGKNNFLRSIEKKARTFEVCGSLTTTIASNQGWQKNNTLNIGENYWQPAKWNYSIDSIKEKYTYLGYYDLGGHFNEVELAGKLAIGQFIKCYDPNASISSAMKLSGLDLEYSDVKMEYHIGNDVIKNNIFDWPVNAEIYTVDGKLLQKLSTDKYSQCYGIGISSGMYILRWTDAENTINSKKIMILEK